jgi:phytoene dehydrogenase-like protein
LGYLDEYDGIILGAGHNGLIAQAYLTRAGLKVLSIDRAQHAGGGLTTAEDNSIPGIFHGTHAVSFRGITGTPWYQDLELDKWSVEMVEPDPNMASILADGRSFCWYLDAERTAKSIEAFSTADADTWRTIASEYRELTRTIIGPELQSRPIAEDERAAILSKSALGRTYADLLKLSPRQFIEDNFETPALKAMLLYFCIIREVDVNVPGQGHLIPSFLATSRPGQIVKGGSYALARGLKHDIYAHGGHIMEQVEVRRIRVENGRAVGVELLDGRTIRAGFVASSLNPHQTFLELLGDGAVSDEVSGKAEGYKYQTVGPIFGVNIAIRDEPRYTAATTNPDVAKALLVFLGLDDPAAVYRLYDEAEDGRLSEHMMLIGACPTQHDPTQASSGNNAAFMWRKTPYNLNGDPLTWETEKPRQLQGILDFWARYAPNVQGGNLLHAFAGSPLDTQRRYPSMGRGDLFHGWCGPGQRGVDRPFAGGTPYRAIEPQRLYLCGSSTHPGGNITGNPGYIAAGEILSDLGIGHWWTPRDVWADLSKASLSD